MAYEDWCDKYIKPIVSQFNDGAITLDELNSAIVGANTIHGDEWTRSNPTT